MRKQGFTLIEVMVVLSILALIAVLAYSYFGSTMKEAKLKQGAVKIFNDMQALETAYLQYELTTGAAPTTRQTAAINDLVGAGAIRSFPLLDQSWKGADTGGTPGYRVDYNYDSYPDGGPDILEAIDVNGVTKEVCLKVQELYSSLGGTQAWDYNKSNAEPTMYPSNEPVWCETWDSDATDDYYVVMKIRSH